MKFTKLLLTLIFTFLFIIQAVPSQAFFEGLDGTQDKTEVHDSYNAGAGEVAGKQVILDTNAVFRLNEAKQLMKPGEIPVITRTTMAELRNLKAQGRMGIPKYIDDLKIIDDVGSVNTRINVRGTMYEIADLQKSKVKGNMFADGSIGATALETGNPIITFDKLFKKALQKMGGDVR